MRFFLPIAAVVAVFCPLAPVAALTPIDASRGGSAFTWIAPASPVNAKAALGAKQRLAAMGPAFGVQASDIDALAPVDAQSLPGGARVERFVQSHAGIEVFRGGVATVSDAHGRLVAVSGRPVALPPLASKAGDLAAFGFRLDARDALARVLDDQALPGRFLAKGATEARRDGGWRGFESAATLKSGATIASMRARPVWFPEAGGLLPAWQIETVVGDAAWAHVVSAKDGRRLFRHSLRAHDAHRYRVWADPATLRPLSGPQGNGHFPHPSGLPDGTQPAFVPSALVTLQDASPLRDDPWLPAGATSLSGNHVEMLADRAAPDGFSAGDARATASSPGTFDRAYDLAAAPGASVTQAQASATHAFYTANWLHDVFHDAGFDEAAGNAQADNYGRGGLAGDAMRIDVQDHSGVDNANMFTPADGARPRMQMFVFRGTAQPSLVLAPGGEAIAAQGAGFGASTYNLSAPLAAQIDGVAGSGTTLDGCEASSVSLAGRVALVDRGLCPFVQKAQNAQAAGAIALVVANNEDVGASPVGGTEPAVTIPVVGISKADGASMRQRIAVATTTATLQRGAAIDRDGALDSGVVAHEWGHYISGRLVGNATGLSSLQARGMGEGWGDFHALMLLAGEGSDPDGVYAAMGHANGGAPPNDSYYYGLRRYPYSTRLDRNPLSFRHVQDSAVLPTNVPNRAGGANSEVHNTGEVWASLLWECYAGLLKDHTRLGFAEAESRMRSYLVAGYKLTPDAPTFIEARDALLAAMHAADPRDFAICARGFARRGAGVGARAPARDAAGNEGVVESFTADAGVLEIVDARLSDAIGACDLDGRLDGGELGTLELSLRNTGFAPLSQARLALSSASPGVAFPQGNEVAVPAVAPYATAQVLVPVAYAPTTGRQTLAFGLQWRAPNLAGASTAALSYGANFDVAANALANDDAESPTPAWTSQQAGTNATGKAWRRVEVAPGQHRFHGPDGDGTGVSAWVSPRLQAGSQPLVVSFWHRHDFEAGFGTRWDGGVVEISRDDGVTWSDVGAAARPGYNGTLGTSAGNPYGGRAAYTSRNATWPALEIVTLDLGTTYAGQSIRLRFAVATDLAAGGQGWEIDDIAVAGLANTPFPGIVPQRMVCGSAGAIPGARIFASGFD